MVTPLYQSLKTNGTTLYVFPGAAEDDAAAKYNPNITMNFSKFALLNLPQQNTTSPLHKVFNFTQDFNYINLYTAPSTAPNIFGDSLIESLRNYAANQEASMRSSMTSTTDYLYDGTQPNTICERVFWKWLHKLGVIDFEVAEDGVQWDSTNSDFTNPTTGDTFFNSYLWRERVVTPYNISAASWTGSVLTVVCGISTLFKPGDVVNLTLTSSTSPSIGGNYVIATVATTTLRNDTITISMASNPGTITYNGTTATLVYNRVVQEVGEVLGTTNVIQASGAYSQVFTLVPAQNGQTPVVLFKTVSDNNYRPGITFPVLLSQQQPEIVGAENPQSPIVTTPSNYPGGWWGMFDTPSYTYTSSTGDYLRQQGAYYGVITAQQSLLQPGAEMYPDFSANNLDGIEIDTNIAHYFQAVNATPPCGTFDEYNGTAFNNTAPADYDCNAILWYYDLVDTTSGTAVTTTNLYGITFLDNSANFPSTFNEIPVIQKLVSNGTQDGTSYTFSITLTSDADNSTTPDLYDPTKVYSLFNLELYNAALQTLATLNDSFSSALGQVAAMQQQLNNIQNLIYTQQSIAAINVRMNSLESLITLYSTLQIGNSDSIIATTNTNTTPPSVVLTSIDPAFSAITNINTSDLFVNQLNSGLTTVLSEPQTISFSGGKNFAVIINNDDDDNNVNVTYATPPPNLQVIFEQDLSYKQQCEIFILPDNAVNDKGLQILVNYNDTTTITPQLIAGPLPLPVDRYSKLVDGSNLEPIDKWLSHPKFVPTQVSLCKVNSTVRTITLDFDGDLTDIAAGSRIILNDITIVDPITTTTYNVSGVFTVYQTPSYIPCPIENVSLVSGGVNTTLGAGTYTYTIYSPVTNSTVGGAQILVTITGSAGSGTVSNVQLLSGGQGYTRTTSWLLMNATTDAHISTNIALTTGTAAPEFQFFPKVRTRLYLTLDPNNVTHAALISGFNAYTVFGTTTLPNVANNYLLPLNPYLLNYPYMDFNRGYHITITNILETPTTPATNWSDRYRVDIEHL